MTRTFVNWKKLVPGLLVFVGAGTITVALAADLIGIGSQTGLGRKQIVLVLAGFATLLSGSILASPPVQRHLPLFIAKLIANWRNPEATQSMSSLPGVILGIVLLSLSVLTWPGILGSIVSLDWKIGNVQSVAYGLQVALAILAVISILGRRRVSFVYARLFPTRKEFLFAFIALTASVILTFLAFEIGLRILGQPFTETWEPQEHMRAQFDPELGWSYMPNQSRRVEFVPGESAVLVHHNDLGVRVRVPRTEYDQTSPTLLLIGGSFTMGFGLPYEETFGGRLESIPDFPYQVINLGVEAYGTDQSLLMLKRYFHNFNTKLVIYTFSGAHLDRNSNYDRRVILQDARFIGTKPLFGLKPDGTLYLKKKPLEYGELPYSRVLAIFQIYWYRWGPKLDFDLTHALVREMKDYVEARGATLIVVDWDWDFPGTQQGDPSPFEGMYVNLIDTGDDAPRGWSEWRIPEDSHPNAEATSRVAQLIYEELIDLDLIK